MAVTVQELVDSFPELEPLCGKKGFIEAKLMLATEMIDPAAYGPKADLATKMMAMRLIALDPCGRAAGLSDDKGNTIYDSITKQSTFAIGCRVT